jgi:hypothetical protein
MFNPHQQQIIGQRINVELGKVTLSWSNEMREWHPAALNALRSGSVSSLETTSKNYHMLLLSDKHGINANVVAVLCNNIERTTPAQMCMTIEDWCELLELNEKIAASWESLCAPIREKVIEAAKIEWGIGTKIKTMNTVN